MAEDNEQPKRGDLEGTKLATDLMKHVATLASGSIVLVATLLDKFPKPIIGSGWLVGSVISLVLCLACSLYFLMVLLVWKYWVPEYFPDFALRSSNSFSMWTTGAASLLAGWSFLGGILCLGIFAIKNLHRLQGLQ
jgi:hypothetical protein